MSMVFEGTAFKFGRDVDTDVIIPARYLNTTDPQELAAHVMEDIDREFVNEVKAGDIIAAEDNFGCGSSREQAPVAIKAAGVACVVAVSFARIFYRNAINTGLPVLECDTDLIGPGDELAANLEEGVLENRTTGVRIPVKPLPRVMIQILQDGGLAAHFRKYGTFRLDA